MGALTDLLLDPSAQPETPSLPGIPSLTGPDAPSLTEQLLSGIAREREEISQQPFPPRGEGPSMAREIVTGIGDIFTGGERTTERTQAATPILDRPTGNTFDDIRMATGFMLTLDPQAQTNLVKNLIPGVEVSQDETGSTFFKVPGEEEEFILNRPGLSPQDASALIAQALAFVPAARIGQFASGLTNFAARLGAGTATSVGLDVGAETLGATGAAELGGAGIRGTLAGLGTAIFPPTTRAVGGGIGRQALRARGQVPAPPGATAETAGTIAEAQRVSDELGLGLFRAQKSGIPEEEAFSAQLSKLPGAVRTARVALRGLNERVDASVGRFMDRIAPATASETGELRVLTAAKETLKRAELIRDAKSSRLFGDAFAEGRQIRTGGIVYPKTSDSGKIFNLVKKARETIEGAGGDLEKLHLAHLEIAETIGEVTGIRIGGTAKRKLTNIHTQLMDELKGQSESYRIANQAFIDASPPVDIVKRSLVGRLATSVDDFGNISDAQLDAVSATLFRPRINTSVIANARKAIREVDPDAWDEILRVELEKRIGSISEVKRGIPDTAQDLRTAIFGTGKKKNVLLAAMSHEQEQAARLLDKGLEMAARGRTGTATMTREEALQRVRGGIGLAIRDFLAGIKETTVRAGESAIVQARTKALAKLYYDPAFTGDLIAIGKLSDPNKALKAMNTLLNAALVSQTRAIGTSSNGQ